MASFSADLGRVLSIGYFKRAKVWVGPMTGVRMAPTIGDPAEIKEGCRHVVSATWVVVELPQPYTYTWTKKQGGLGTYHSDIEHLPAQILFESWVFASALEEESLPLWAARLRAGEEIEREHLVGMWATMRLSCMDISYGLEAPKSLEGYYEQYHSKKARGGLYWMCTYRHADTTHGSIRHHKGLTAVLLP